MQKIKNYLFVSLLAGHLGHLCHDITITITITITIEITITITITITILRQLTTSSTDTSQPPMIPIILTSIYDSSENICKPQVVMIFIMMIFMMMIFIMMILAIVMFSMRINMTASRISAILRLRWYS